MVFTTEKINTKIIGDTTTKKPFSGNKNCFQRTDGRKNLYRQLIIGRCRRRRQSL